jgi:lipooligosaccharide transport system permease protein
VSSPTLTTRVVPAALTGTRAHRLLERNFMVSRRSWTVILSGFFEPVFYLFSIGVGVGKLVGDLTLSDGSTVSYAMFVAPALLASSAMNGAIFESTINIFFKLKWGKTYDAILATPMRPIDIAAGEIGWSLIRGGIYSVGFMVVMASFGLARSWWAIMAIPSALLIGFAFAAVGMAATTYMKSWQHFDLVNLVSLPLFRFSATVYPLDIYPPLLQKLTQLSPLYHGVELIRGFTLGSFDPTLILHAAVLALLGAVGLAITSRRLEALLLS